MDARVISSKNLAFVSKDGVPFYDGEAVVGYRSIYEMITKHEGYHRKDVRHGTIKFYTERGEYRLVDKLGNHFPLYGFDSLEREATS